MLSTKKQYEGGFVLQPEAGIYENVAVLDFRSLYPSIIITHNIDRHTFTVKRPSDTRNKVPGFHRWFLTRPEGEIPHRLKKILDDRKKVKQQIKKEKDQKKLAKLKKREQSLKLAANITYGYFGYPNSPYYSVKVAESIAAFGRFYIKQVISRAEKVGFKVIYGDTDSVFIISKNTAKAKKFVKRINKWLPGIIKLEFRGIYKRGLFVTTRKGIGAKKKYALLSKSGKLEIRGFETRRGDWCELAKETQYKILEYVLKKQRPDLAVKFTKSIVKKLKLRKFPVSKLVLSKQLSRPLSEYKATGPHIAVARLLEKQGKKIKEDEIIRFVITKRKGSISDRAIPDKDAKISDIDINYYIDNQIIPAALRVLSVFGIKEGNL